MKTGLVENERFVFFSPITIDRDDVVIRSCKLLFSVPPECKSFLLTVTSQRATLENCVIERSEFAPTLGDLVKEALDAA